MARMAAEQIQALDERAVAEDLRFETGKPNRSELIRIMCAYAQQHMPPGWRPTWQEASQATEDGS